MRVRLTGHKMHGRGGGGGECVVWREVRRVHRSRLKEVKWCWNGVENAHKSTPTPTLPPPVHHDAHISISICSSIHYVAVEMPKTVNNQSIGNWMRFCANPPIERVHDHIVAREKGVTHHTHTHTDGLWRLNGIRFSTLFSFVFLVFVSLFIFLFVTSSLWCVFH